MVERRRTSVRGYIPAERIRPDAGIDFVLRRRGPARPRIETELREKMDEYAAGQGILGSMIEYIVHYQLTRRRLVDGVHYSFQSSMFGGRLELGGMVVDFLFNDRPLAVRVMGTYWHPAWQAMGLGANDEEQRLVLESMGLVVEDLWENVVMDNDRLEDWMVRKIDTPVVRGMWTA